MLGIDSTARTLRAEISDVDRKLADPNLPVWRRESLTARRRALWQAHDDSMQSWQWKARRIARTESHGAVNAGQLAAAIAAEAETGETYHKRWLSTDDVRTRATHRVADGQTVPLTAKFRVGGYLLSHPGDPITIAPHETINCRCSMLLYDPDTVQDALQGPHGSLGEIRPGGVRLGTDDPDAAAEAIRRVAEDEQRALPPDPDARGEDAGQDPPPATPEVELTDEREVPTVPPVTDLSAYSDDELFSLLMDANRADDDELYRAAMAEYERRTDRAVRPVDLDDDLSEDVTDVTDDTSDVNSPEVVALLAELDDDDLDALIDDTRNDGGDNLLRVLEAERDRRRGLTAASINRRRLSGLRWNQTQQRRTRDGRFASRGGNVGMRREGLPHDWSTEGCGGTSCEVSHARVGTSIGSRTIYGRTPTRWVDTSTVPASPARRSSPRDGRRRRSWMRSLTPA